MFWVIGPRCWTGSSMLDCHVLKGFGIYMIGILGSLFDVVGGFSRMSFTPRIIYSLIYNKGLESTLFLFLPLTKLPHPNTIYRYIGWPGVGRWVLAFELC